MVECLISELTTPARFDKAVQHLQERGELEGSPRDIGKIIIEFKKDLEEECRNYISDKLVAWALPNILRGTSGGIPQWYKEKLMEKQFKGETE